MNTKAELHVAVCEMTFRQMGSPPVDITSFNWALGTFGGAIVPIRDYGISNFEPDGFGQFHVQFERALNHVAWLEVIALARSHGFEWTTREQATELVRRGAK